MSDEKNKKNLLTEIDEWWNAERKMSIFQQISFWREREYFYTTNNELAET